MLALLAFGVAMLLLLGAETKPAPPRNGWWTEPVLAPAFSLLVMTAGAAIVLGQMLFAFMRHGRHGGPILFSLPLLDELRIVAEYSVYFVLYVWAVDKLGYALSTFCFAQIACWRAGLRGWRTLLNVILLTAVLVVFFRVVLTVWFPPAQIYEILPDRIRNFALLHL